MNKFLATVALSATIFFHANGQNNKPNTMPSASDLNVSVKDPYLQQNKYNCDELRRLLQEHAWKKFMKTVTINEEITQFSATSSNWIDTLDATIWTDANLYIIMEKEKAILLWVMLTAENDVENNANLIQIPLCEIINQELLSVLLSEWQSSLTIEDVQAALLNPWWQMELWQILWTLQIKTNQFIMAAKWETIRLIRLENYKDIEEIDNSNGNHVSDNASQNNNLPTPKYNQWNFVTQNGSLIMIVNQTEWTFTKSEAATINSKDFINYLKGIYPNDKDLNINIVRDVLKKFRSSPWVK